MVAVGLNTSNHLTGIVRMDREVLSCCCARHPDVLFSTFFRLTYVAVFLAALFLIQAFIDAFKLLTASVSAPWCLKCLLKPIAQTLSATVKVSKRCPRRLMLETAMWYDKFLLATILPPKDL